MRITIGLKGVVKEAHIHADELKSPGLNQCLLSNVKTLRFDDPKSGDVTIVYPLIFKRSD